MHLSSHLFSTLHILWHTNWHEDYQSTLVDYHNIILSNVYLTYFAFYVTERHVVYKREGPHCTGKTEKMVLKILCQGKYMEFGNFAKIQGKHREFCLLK